MAKIDKKQVDRLHELLQEIAADNDRTWEDCQQQNQECKRLVLSGKDWNDDLLS